MKNDLNKIESKDLNWFNTTYCNEKVTFVCIYEIPYLLLTPVLTDTVCQHCKNKNLMTWLIGRENIPYRFSYCVDCKTGTLVESKNDYDKIPFKVLALMNENFVLKKEEENEKI